MLVKDDIHSTFFYNRNNPVICIRGNIWIIAPLKKFHFHCVHAFECNPFLNISSVSAFRTSSVSAFRRMENEIPILDFNDTFLSIDHLRNSFPNYDIEVKVDDETKLVPPFR